MPPARRDPVLFGPESERGASRAGPFFLSAAATPRPAVAGPRTAKPQAMTWPVLYVDGCDVCLDAATAHNVRANLGALRGRGFLLRPGDVAALGRGEVLDGRGCLALPAPRDALRVLPGTPGGSGALVLELQRLVRAGSSAGQAIAAAAGRLVDGGRADWLLVPGGPLADVGALRSARHVVLGGVRVGGSG